MTIDKNKEILVKCRLDEKNQKPFSSAFTHCFKFLLTDWEKIDKKYFANREKKANSFIWISENVLQNYCQNKKFEIGKEYVFTILKQTEQVEIFKDRYNNNEIFLLGKKSFSKWIKTITDESGSSVYYSVNNSIISSNNQDNIIKEKNNWVFLRTILFLLPILTLGIIFLLFIRWKQNQKSIRY